ncbi:MAG: hypothetical protein H0T83_02545 [Chthoniobacterales bacterium]|nr:hypothetical protein [Chthoniobacterales bacterium]
MIEPSIQVIKDAPFLTEAQKRDIFYNNAARFLRLSAEESAAIKRCNPRRSFDKIGPEGISDALYERARAHVSGVQLSELSCAVGVINLWNRLNFGFRNALVSLMKCRV